MPEQKIEIPPSWQQLDLAQLRDVAMVIGAPDTGKSTLARYLYRRLCDESRRVAYLDGDPGQSTIGPPATLTVAFSQADDATFPPKGQRWQRFIGAVSPRGHMLPMLVGASRLVRAAGDAGAETIIYDTCGLVDPAQGGTALKLAEIDLLRPAVVCAIQRDDELEALLEPLRRSQRAEVMSLRPAPAAKSRDRSARQARRAAMFADYFRDGHSLTITWTQVAIFPELKFISNRLVALEDEQGFTLGLGLVKNFDVKARQVTLATPLSSMDQVDALRLGDISLNPDTFEDQRL